MRHPDERTLAKAALGEDTAAVVAAHLGRCEGCRGELETLRRAVASLRVPSPVDDGLIAPPGRVWSAITAALRSPVAPAPPADAAEGGDAGDGEDGRDGNRPA